MKKIIPFLIFVTLVLAACAPQVVCNTPYIKVGTSCCLDKNNNSICDTDDKPAEKSLEAPKSSETSASLSSTSALSKEDIEEAIKFGESKKLSTLEIPYKAGNNDILFYTPYAEMAFAAANKAKEYKKLTDEEIKEASKDQLIVTVTIRGYSYSDVEGTKAVLKYDDEVLQPSYSSRISASVDDCSGSSCTWSGTGVFIFPNHNEYTNKKVQFVLIKFSSEKVYDIDMSKYR